MRKGCLVFVLFLFSCTDAPVERLFSRQDSQALLQTKVQWGAKQCDFGLVPTGQMAQCVVSVQNTGSEEYIVKDATWDAPAVPFGFLGKSFGKGFSLRPGDKVNVVFKFAPDAVGKFKAELWVASNDTQRPTMPLTFTGEGVLGPKALCKIKSINDQPYAASVGVKPLDEVVVTAEGSSAQVGNAAIANYQWTLVKQPAGSTAQFVSPNTKESGFSFANGVTGIDLAGEYVVKLQVTDSLGLKSSNECWVQFEAIPKDALHVQLVWNTGYGDMDLHLAKQDEQSRYCVSGLSPGADENAGPLAKKCNEPKELTYMDCNFSTCIPEKSIAEKPNWDLDVAKNTAGDPSLDIDNRTGYGPENINVQEPLPGSYLVAAHNYGGGVTAGNTVRIYLYGQLVAEFYRMLEPSDWWEVAVVHWTKNGHPCVEDLSTHQTKCL